MGERLSTRSGARPPRRRVRERAEGLWHSQLLRAYAPGIVATTTVLAAMFAIRWFA
ncbi:MAG: hypothetical protein ABIQ73_10045 [Acidimicrobiales bacterium]